VVKCDRISFLRCNLNGKNVKEQKLCFWLPVSYTIQGKKIQTWCSYALNGPNKKGNFHHTGENLSISYL
jgi:hypothetical protein